MLTLEIKTRFRGYHRWPAALPPVQFLRSLHRHEFHVALQVLVTEENRQLEFFTLQGKLEKAIARNLRPMMDPDNAVDAKEGEYSCETIARILFEAVKLELSLLSSKSRVVSVSCHEDGENGAIYSE